MFKDMPLWFKLWMAFCFLLGMSVLGFGVWVVIELLDMARTAAGG